MPTERWDVEAVQSLCDAATKGPWRIGFVDHSWQLGVEGIVHGEEGDDDAYVVLCENGRSSGHMDEDDKAFCIQSRTLLPHANEAILEARQIAQDFGYHTRQCGLYTGVGTRCTCGYDEVREIMEAWG